jgi:hypothetical protein
MDVVSAVQTAIAFVWLGMVLGISFLEAPLKFRAPGITIPLGVGIGRLVFRALNLVEAVFALVLIVTLVLAWPPAVSTAVIVGALVVVLAIGAGVLRPRMDARVRRGELSEGQPRHALHIGFVALETAKVLLLLALGILLLAA